MSTFRYATTDDRKSPDRLKVITTNNRKSLQELNAINKKLRADIDITKVAMNTSIYRMETNRSSSCKWVDRLLDKCDDSTGLYLEPYIPIIIFIELCVMVVYFFINISSH
jgi:hypothetical protein